MKNVFRALSGVAAAFVLAFGITVGIAEQTLPDSFIECGGCFVSGIVVR